MSHQLSRRLDRLDRIREWDEAMAYVDRLLEAEFFREFAAWQRDQQPESPR